MMFLTNWYDVFVVSLQGLFSEFMHFIPNILGAVVFFMIGWLVGSLVCKAIKQLFEMAKVDSLFESAGINEAFNKVGVTFSLGGLIGWIVKWFIIIGMFMGSLQLLGLSDVSMFLGGKVVIYLGNVLIAILILMVGFVLANFVKKVVEVGARAVKAPAASFLGSLTRYAIIVFAFAIALPKLLVLDQDIFINLLMSFVQPLIWAVALAIALAFGLGGKETAARALDKFTKEMSGKN